MFRSDTPARHTLTSKTTLSGFSNDAHPTYILFVTGTVISIIAGLQ